MSARPVESPARGGQGGRGLLARVGLTFCYVFATTTAVSAADPAEAEKLFRTGKYAECEQLAADEIAKGADASSWWVLKCRSEVVRGKYDAAGKTIEEAHAKFP